MAPSTQHSSRGSRVIPAGCIVAINGKGPATTVRYPTGLRCWRREILDKFRSLIDANRKGDRRHSQRLTDPSGNNLLAPGDIRRSESAPIEAKRFVPLRSGATGVTFCVDDVAGAQKPLLQLTLRESLELRAGTSLLAMPDETKSAVAPEGFLTKHHHPDRHEFLNPLVEAVHLAFSDHRPLVLTPDCIWLTIVQGFGHHLHEHVEALRGRIVRHEGKKQLCIETPSLDSGHWQEMISTFSAQIREYSDPVLYETLRCDFSTTTPTIRAASDVALMEAYQRYFEFILMCVCGIPSITVEGTPEDWKRIQERLEVLETFGLKWWTSRLALILDEFVATSGGAPDLAFWRAIYKPEKAYATDVATGWIADLFPYLGNPPHRCVNPLLKEPRIDWLPCDKGKKHFPNGVGLQAIPCGLSRAPVTVIFSDHSQKEVDLLGGLLGVSQNEEDLSLAPIISWAVVERDRRSAPPAGKESR